MHKKIITIGLAACFLTGCVSEDPYTGQQTLSHQTVAGGVGAALGAAIGQMFGETDHGRSNGALIGAGIGLLGGSFFGHYFDQQEALLRKELRTTGVSVTRRGTNIILNMPTDITFSTNMAVVRPSFYRVLRSVGFVLKKFNHSKVNVYGFTDSTGPKPFNDKLSQERAEAVAEIFRAQGIDSGRLSVMGYGADNPVASNATASGRARNRRVEIHIAPQY